MTPTIKEFRDDLLEKVDYILDDPCIHKIIMYYKDELKNKLRVALEPFKDKIKIPLQISINLHYDS